jgi:hypothetical protein
MVRAPIQPFHYAGEAVHAMSASRVQPRHANAISLFYDGHAGTDCGDGPDALMPRYEWWVGLYRPVAIGGM